MAQTGRPRAYRPFRVLMYALFIGLTSVATLLALTSIVRNLRAPSALPGPQVVVPGEAVTATAYRTCERRLQRLHRELDRSFDQASDLAAEAGTDALARWQAFSRDWEARLAAASTACAIGTGPSGDGRAERLELLEDQLETLHRVYGTHVTRFLREDGDTVRAAEAAFGAAAPLE